MIATASSAFAEIGRLGLPEVFSAVWSDKVPIPLRSEWKKPHAYFKVCHELSGRVQALAGLCPLWEQNGEAIIGRLPDGRYVRFYYEDAQQGTVELLGASYQQFVTSILLELIYAGLCDRYDAVAALLGYRYTRELRTLLEADCSDDDLQHFRESTCEKRA